MNNNNYVGLGNFLGSLEKVRKQGQGFMACCPAHDDRNPSLSIREVSDGIWPNCFAGCSQQEVCDAIGIEQSQLYRYRNTDGWNEIEDIYPYRDESGELLFEIVRKRNKQFVCRQVVGDGEYEYNLQGVRRVPFALTELSEFSNSSDAEEGTVFVVEGEKDVLTLQGLGLVATCNPHGAGKWRDDYSEYLSGLNCVVLQDNDDSGRDHAEEVANSLSTRAKTVKVIQLPDLPDKGDVTDWIKAENTVVDLDKLVAEAPTWAPTVEGPVDGPTGGLDFKLLSNRFETPIPEKKWVVKRLLHSNGISIIAGIPKAGKSTLTRYLAYCVAEGEEFLGRETCKGPVLFCSFEEIETEVLKQFHALGTEGSDIRTHHGRYAGDDFLRDLKSAITLYEPSIVFLDPLIRVLRVSSLDDYVKVSEAIEPFVDIARESAVHICLIHHERKQQGGYGLGLLGSTALHGAIDAMLTVNRDGKKRMIETPSLRFGDEIERSELILDKSTMKVTLGDSAEYASLEDTKQNVLEAFIGGEWLKIGDIVERVKGSKLKVSKAIKQLVAAGQLKQKGEGVKGKPFEYAINANGGGSLLEAFESTM